MSYQRLGHAALARLHCDQACTWMDANRPKDLEQSRVRREASTQLEIQRDTDGEDLPSPLYGRAASPQPSFNAALTVASERPGYGRRLPVSRAGT